MTSVSQYDEAYNKARKESLRKRKECVYIPQWHVEEILCFLRGHIIEGDVTRKQLITAIDTYLAELDEAETEEYVPKEKYNV